MLGVSEENMNLKVVMGQDLCTLRSLVWDAGHCEGSSEISLVL